MVIAMEKGDDGRIWFHFFYTNSSNVNNITVCVTTRWHPLGFWKVERPKIQPVPLQSGVVNVNVNRYFKTKQNALYNYLHFRAICSNIAFEYKTNTVFIGKLLCLFWQNVDPLVAGVRRTLWIILNYACSQSHTFFLRMQKKKPTKPINNDMTLKPFICFV